MRHPGICSAFGRSILFPGAAEMGDDWVRFPFHVHREEYLGAERLLYGEIGKAKAVARFPATAESISNQEVGRTSDFAVRRRDLKRFRCETGSASRPQWESAASVQAQADVAPLTQVRHGRYLARPGRVAGAAAARCRRSSTSSRWSASRSSSRSSIASAMSRSATRASIGWGLITSGRSSPTRPFSTALQEHVRLHHRLAGYRASCWRTSWRMVLSADFPRQAAGALPDPAPVDDADRALDDRLALDARQLYSPIDAVLRISVSSAAGTRSVPTDRQNASGSRNPDLARFSVLTVTSGGRCRWRRSSCWRG